MKTCWKNLLLETISRWDGDNLVAIVLNDGKGLKRENCIPVTLDCPEMTKMFDIDDISNESVLFTAWGEKYVYFPVLGVKGLAGVMFAPRFPPLFSLKGGAHNEDMLER